jgi:uncharacterized protein YkwD
VAVVLSLCALTALGAAQPALAAREACPGERLRPTPANAATVNQATLCLIDRIREAHHLRELRSNPQLLGVANSQVASMIHRDYFADVRPSGQTPLSLIDVTAYPAHAADIAVGQNIAWGVGPYSTARHIVAEWMRSPPHRANILSGAYRDAGVAVTPAVPGVLRAGHRGATYAMEFGVRRF